MSKSKEKLVEVRNLKKHFKVGRKQILKAVDGLTFDIYKGETFGLVGESGSGKSTAGRTIMRLYDATEGQVMFKGKSVHGKKTKDELKELNQNMQMIFQDPYASLNPRMTVMDIIAEGLDIHGLVKTKEERQRKVNELLKIVGLNEEHANRYPHEFSGGQRQRIGIARAISLNPSFLVCDEPVSALDVSIHAQILNLLVEIQEKLKLTYVFISHNLADVKNLCDRMAVMYLGKVMESGDSDAIFKNPKHPYTQALLAAVLDTSFDEKRKQVILQGDIPSPINPPLGCRFWQRCPQAMEGCKTVPPSLIEVEEDHHVACHLVNGFPDVDLPKGYDQILAKQESKGYGHGRAGA